MALTDLTRQEMRQIIARYPQPRSALLPMLHLVQSYEGYVTPAGIEMCAAELGLTEAEVSAVATFYTMYKRRPVGDYHVGVCTTALCAVMGGDAILAALKEHLGVGNDETTPDGTVSLEHVECNAACDYAPVVMVNWEFFDNQTPASARDLVDRLRAGEQVAPTRGPSRVCTWREAERVLAGFPDGLAGQGVAAGAASLAGLRLAKERGWSAPEPEEQPVTRQPVTRQPVTRRSTTPQPARGKPAPGPATAQPAPVPAGRPHSGSDEPAQTAESDRANPAEAGDDAPATARSATQATEPAGSPQEGATGASATPPPGTRRPRGGRR